MDLSSDQGCNCSKESKQYNEESFSPENSKSECSDCLYNLPVNVTLRKSDLVVDCRPKLTLDLTIHDVRGCTEKV